MVTAVSRAEYTDLRGGQNTKLAPYLLRPGEFTLLQNVWLDARGQIEKRPGYVPACPQELSPPSATVHGAETYYYTLSSTTADVIYWRNGSAYRETDCAATIQAIVGLTGFHATNMMNMSNAKNRLYGVNGVGGFCLDGTTPFAALGLTAPTAPSVALGAAGAMNGAYYYKITFTYGARGESNGGTPSALVSPVNQKVDMSSIPTGGTGCTQRHIYRTLAGVASSGTYYFVATLNNNSTTVYTDNATDGELGDELETDNDAPPTAKYLTWWKNMMFYAGNPTVPRRLYVSKIGNPEQVPATTHFIDVPTAGDEITGMAALNEVLLIFTDTAIFALTGGQPATFQFRFVEAQIGCTAPYSIATHNGAAYWLYHERAYRSFGGQAEPISDNIDNSWVPTTRDNLRDARGKVWNSKYLLALFMGSTAYASKNGAADDTAANNKVFVLDLILKDQAEDGRESAWCVWTNIFPHVFCVKKGPTLNREVLLWGSNRNTGILFQQSAGGAGGAFSDNGTAITVRIETQDHAEAMVGWLKKWKRLEAILLGATGLTLTAYYKIDQATAWTAMVVKTLTADRGLIHTARWKFPGQIQGHYGRWAWEESSTSYLLFYSYQTEHIRLRRLEA